MQIKLIYSCCSSKYISSVSGLVFAGRKAWVLIMFGTNFIHNKYSVDKILKSNLFD